MFHDTIDTLEEAFLKAGIQEAVVNEIPFEALGKDTMEEFANSWGEGDRPEIFWNTIVPLLMKKEDAATAPGGGGKKDVKILENRVARKRWVQGRFFRWK